MAHETNTYQDAALPVEERVEDLLGRMTTEEKLAQLTSVMSYRLVGADGVADEALQEHLGGGIGEISMTTMMTPDPAELARAVNRVQQFLREETRLGIPALPHDEALAGFVNESAADFPTAIALAATWDPPSVEAMTDIIRCQMRSVGVRQALSPVLDVARDARWGRLQETYGEDPYLVSAIAVAYVRGLQGSEPSDGVLATAKHFAGYGYAEGGRNMAPVQLGERELREVYARPFAAAIHHAELASVMCAYSDLNGEPVAGSRRVLTDLLRDELGFSGFVVADYLAISHLHNRQRSAADAVDAGIQALGAGLDVELPERSSYGPELAAAIERGVLAEDVVDVSVRRILTAKFRLGLFDDPYVAPDAFARTGGRAAGRDLARRLAERSIVLLANDGLLPLNPDVRRIAVIGPSADSVRNLFGHYSVPAGAEVKHAFERWVGAALPGTHARDRELAAPAGPDGSSTDILSAIFDDPEAAAFGTWASARVPVPDAALADILALYPDTPTVLAAIRAAAPQGVEVVHSPGCGLDDSETSAIPDAVDIAAGADVAVLVLGDKAGIVFDATSGENRDRTTLELPGTQRALLEAVCATGTPVVVVIVGSRPMPVLAGQGGPAAVLAAWMPGSIGGVAVADVLFGSVNPSGKLPVTIPRTAGQCPIYHGHKPGGEPSSYTDLDDSGPAYVFGHGLSYTSFAYREIEVAEAEVDAAGSFGVTVEVTNAGDRFGEEVVQLYASARRRGVTRPVRELIGFSRVGLEAGASTRVSFDVPVELLAYYDKDMQLVSTAGDVQLFAGGSSGELPLRTSVGIIGDPVVFERRTKFLSDAVVLDTAPI